MKTVKKKSTLIVATATVQKAKKVVAVDLNTLTGDELFLHSLKEIGHPSLVRDMAKTIKQKKLVSLSRRKLLIKFYASASRLARLGAIKRMPINGTMYMYSLAGWKFAKKQSNFGLAA
jgi:hypothetical protein